jgi:butyrate kinase
MKFLANYNNIVLTCLVVFFVYILINHFFRINEGMESTKNEVYEKTIDILNKEMSKLKTELATYEKVVNLNQTKVNALNAQIQTKQTEIDKIQNKIEVDKMSKEAE